MKNLWLVLWSVIGVFCGGRDFVISAFAMLIPAFFLFSLGLLGAGDGKLMAVISGYLGFWNGLYAIWAGMIIGAAWLLCRLRRGGNVQNCLIYLFVWFRQMIHTKELILYGNTPEKDPGRTIPLAACLAAGTYVYLLGLKIGMI